VLTERRSTEGFLKRKSGRPLPEKNYSVSALIQEHCGNGCGQSNVNEKPRTSRARKNQRSHAIPLAATRGGARNQKNWQLHRAGNPKISRDGYDLAVLTLNGGRTQGDLGRLIRALDGSSTRMTESKGADRWARGIGSTKDTKKSLNFTADHFRGSVPAILPTRFRWRFFRVSDLRAGPEDDPTPQT